VKSYRLPPRQVNFGCKTGFGGSSREKTQGKHPIISVEATKKKSPGVGKAKGGVGWVQRNEELNKRAEKKVFGGIDWVGGGISYQALRKKKKKKKQIKKKEKKNKKKKKKKKNKTKLHLRCVLVEGGRKTLGRGIVNEYVYLWVENQSRKNRPRYIGEE